MLNIDKTYICHWSKLTDRKSWLINHLTESNIDNYQWVEDYDKETWNIDDIKKEYPLVFDPNPKGRNLKYSEISLLLKHTWILKDAYKNGYDSVLILEDDVVLDIDFTNKFNEFKNQLPPNWDLCWVGSCCNLHVKTTEGINVYQAIGSRCTHAYIVSKHCINKIINDIKYANDGADWYYNNLISEYNLNNYWFEPSLASQNTNYQTTIQNNEYK
jgi:GR25 family glycosyltransferase involved in LPS biosynthesis